MDNMSDLLNKISSYNLFNYLFPGIVFSVLLTEMTSYNIIIENPLIGFFVYYFIGLIISRVGSLAIEPVLKKTKFVQFADYSDFTMASKQDEKIDILSEANNMYRTLLTMIVVLFVVYGFSLLKEVWIFLDKIEIYLLAMLLFLFFLFSYKKQTNYVRKRVLATLDKQS